jgi:hypothetical protein
MKLSDDEILLDTPFIWRYDACQEQILRRRFLADKIISFSVRGAEAAKLLEKLTGTHRTSCYRALRLNGRFARHLHSDGTMLSWR